MGYDFLRRVGPYILAVGLAALLAWKLHSEGVQSGRNEVLADWTASQLVAEQAVRQLESTWQDRVQSAGAKANEKLRVISDTAGAVAADNDRLRLAATNAAKRAACPGSTAAKGSGGPSDMLAVVLSRAATRAGELAAYADRERIAREECQAAWPQ